MSIEARPAHHGLKVLDLTGDVAGQFCGRLFADYGAEVILVEPPAGAATRFMGPFASDVAPPENSFLFRHLNQGKRGLRLDLADPAAAAELKRLAGAADIVLADPSNERAVEWPDQAIVCRVSDFGVSGPYRHWKGGELVHQALSGVMAVTGAPDREPLYGVGHRASYACGVTAYITCLAALIWRDRTGEGQAVEAVTAEATAAMGQNLVTQYSYSQTYATRKAYPGMLGQMECQDGWLVLFAIRNWPAICEAFGVPEAADDPRFNTPVGVRRNWPAAMDLLKSRAHLLRVDETVARLQAGKVSSERILTLAELLEVDQFRSRGFWKYEPLKPDRVRALGPSFRTTQPCRLLEHDTPRLDGAPAPGWQTAAATRGSRLPTPVLRDRLPLQGVRVLDFTIAWAGPMAARTLAFLGAEVVKVENAAQLDSWRGPATGMSDPGAYPDRDGGDRPYDRQALFNTQNHDKRSISVNLKDPRGVEVVRDLARTCDVVLANFSPHALKRLGLGYEVLSRDNPGLVMVEMPAFGNSGPWSSHVGMGKTMEAASGMARMIGYGDGEPVLTGPAYFDPIGGLHGASAVLTALAARNVTGRGQYVEVAQVEGALHWIGERILAASAEGEAFAPDGNRIPEAAPHDAFPAAGEDQWVAIAVTDDAAWARLVAATGLSELGETRFSTLADRRTRQEEIRTILGRWTAQLSKHEAADLLQGAGVAAAPVNTGADVFRDPFLRSRGLIYEIDHPSVGRREYAGLAYRLSRTPGQIRRPAPRFAEHTHEVLGERLGLAPKEIETLVAEGVIHLHPLAAKSAAPADRTRGSFPRGETAPA